MSVPSPHRDAYRAALKVIDSQRRLLLDAGASSEVMTGMTAITRHLFRLSDKQIDQILEITENNNSRDVRDAAIRKASELSLDDVEKKLHDESLSRGELEAIAIGRFHVPKGSMRTLGNMERLREKILIFVQNERTHSSITELARKIR